MNDELKSAVAKLGVEKFQRHIFLCTDATDPKCAPREQTLRSWEFLKARLKELKLVEPEPLQAPPRCKRPAPMAETLVDCGDTLTTQRPPGATPGALRAHAPSARAGTRVRARALTSVGVLCAGGACSGV